MAYTKIANNVTTVGQLKGILTQFGNKDKISLSGLGGFSVAVDDEGNILFDDNNTIDELIEENN